MAHHFVLQGIATIATSCRGKYRIWNALCVVPVADGVPYITPGYFIKPGVLHASLKGKEYREAVQFLAFAVANIF